MGLFNESKTERIKEKTKGVAGKVGDKTKTVIIEKYNALSPRGKTATLFVVLLVVLILIVAVIFAIGSAISGLVGFFGSAYGIAVLILLLLSVGIYIYLKMSGVIGEQEWYVSLLMVGIIMFILIIFIGTLPILEEAFVSAFPFLLIGALIYGAYLFIKHLPDKETKTIATIIIATIIILIPVSQIFIVPMVYGHPMRYDAYIIRGENGDVRSKVSGGEWALYMSATTTLNPFGATVYQTSRVMWYMGDYEKYYYTITITDYYGKILFKKEMAQIYLTKDDYVHDVGLWYLPNSRYYDVLIQIVVYDSNMNPISHNSAEITNLYGR